MPYLSTKKLPLRGPNAYPVLVAGVLLLIVILMRPEPVLFGLGVTYIVSGPLLWLLRWRRSEPAPAAKESPGDVR